MDDEGNGANYRQMGDDSTGRDDNIDIQIEYPFIKIVHDCLTKVFKSTKKFIEKEVITLVNKIKDEKDFNKLCEKSRAMEQQLINLKKEYQDLTDKEEQLLNNLEKRICHLKHVEEHYHEESVQTEYFEKRLWRLIIEYMLREGFIDSSRILIEELNLQEFTDLEVFTEMLEITESLRNYN
jgi:macrophage erythroblast attacher